MAPDATQHNPDPAHIRRLVEATALPIETCAKRLGIGRSTLFRYLESPTCPYPVQYALEQLRGAGKRARRVFVDKTKGSRDEAEFVAAMTTALADRSPLFRRLKT